MQTTMKSILAGFGISLFLTLSPGPASAALITSTADSSLIGATVEDFSSTPLQSVLANNSLIVGDLTITPLDDVMVVSNYNYSLYGMTGIHLDYAQGAQIRVDFTSPVSALGFNFGAADYNWTLDGYDSNGNLVESVVMPGGSPFNYFYGLNANGVAYVIMTAPILWDYVLIDNFYYVMSSLTFAYMPNTPNQTAIYGNLNGQLGTATGDFQAGLVTLAALPDGDFQAALDELSPEPYAGLRDAGLRVSRAGMATVGERMDSLQLNQTAGIDGRLLFVAATSSMTDTGPANAVSGKNGFSLWARPYRYSANQDGRNTFFGYHHDFFGVTVGADQAIGEHGLIGMLIGKSSGEVDYRQVTAQTDMESIYAGVYAALQNGDYALHAQAAWFKHEFDTIRSLTFNGTTARSAHDAEEIAVTLAGEYLGYKAGDWSVVPGLALEFSRYREDGFTESGAGAFDLVGDAVSDTGLTSRVSLRANKAYTFDKTVLVPEVKVEWLHALGDVDRDATARFAGAGPGTFTVNGVDAERNSFVVGLGVSSTFNETSALYVSYDNEFASDYRSWGVSAGFKYSF